MAASSPGYYPPRAKWYSRFFYIRHGLRRLLPLAHLTLPGGLTLQQFFAALLIPGYAFIATDRPKAGDQEDGAEREATTSRLLKAKRRAQRGVDDKDKGQGETS